MRIFVVCFGSRSLCPGARLQERIICLHGPVTEQTSSLVTAQLLFLESEDPEKPINMYINRSEHASCVPAALGYQRDLECLRSCAVTPNQANDDELCLDPWHTLRSAQRNARTAACVSELTNLLL